MSEEDLSAFDKAMKAMEKLTRRSQEERGSEMGRGPEIPEKDTHAREQGDAGYTAAPRLVPGMHGYQREFETERERDPIKRVPAAPEQEKDAPVRDAVPEDYAAKMLEHKREHLAKAVDLAKGRTGQEPRDAATRDPLDSRRMEYDSPERREAITAHLAKMGVDPHLAVIRDLMERGQAEPPQKAAERAPDMTNRNGPARGRDAQSRERDERGRDER